MAVLFHKLAAINQLFTTNLVGLNFPVPSIKPFAGVAKTDHIVHGDSRAPHFGKPLASRKRTYIARLDMNLISRFKQVIKIKNNANKIVTTLKVKKKSYAHHNKTFENALILS